MIRDFGVVQDLSRALKAGSPALVTGSSIYVFVLNPNGSKQ